MPELCNNCANNRKNTTPIVGKRIADDILKRKLEGKGAVLIEGPKWCGKTTTAEQFAASVLYMDDPEKKEQNITMSELNPKRLLKGATARLIEEGAASLKSMVAKIDTTKMNNPSFLMVLTGTGDYAYCRQDGVYVVPIGCLKD